MINCPVCRGQMPVDCPGCGVVEKPSLDLMVNDEFFKMMDQIHDEMFRDVGEPTDYEYYPGCYEG